MAFRKGDGMTEFDNRNRGSIWKNERKTKDTHPDFTGTLNVEGREYFFDAWKRKEGAPAKAPSLTFKVKPKDAQPEGHPDRFQQQVPVNRQRPSGIPERPRQVREDELADDIPF